jgi:hypothetical protein
VVDRLTGEPGEERRDPTTTLAGWRRFIDAAPASFELLPSPALDGLTPESRNAHMKRPVKLLHLIRWHCHPG